MFKHILVPTDGSPLSQFALERAATFARETGAKVSVLHVEHDVQPAYFSVGAITDAHAQQDAQARVEQASNEALDAAETVMQNAGLECVRITKHGAHVYEQIIAAAEENACDLIFMASHGRRGVNALLLGSETQKVLTHSKIPVLVYR